MRPQVESVYVATRCAILPRTPLTSSALAWRQPAIAYTQHCKAKGQISVKRPAIPFYYVARRTGTAVHWIRNQVARSL